MKKIGIITGASSGMGKEFALQLSQTKQLDELWLIARRRNNLEELARTIKNTCSEKQFNTNLIPKIIELDICGKEGANKFAEILHQEKTEETTISILVNNAGFGTYGTFEDTPTEKEIEMIELNCSSLTGICGYSIPYMNKDSIIINTASLASFMPLGNFAVYAGTKAYVLSFSVALAAELKPKGIKVCALCPGPVSTEFANVASNGAREKVKHGLPADKVVKHCLKKATKGKTIVLYAFKWKFAAFGSRFVGKNLVAWYTYKFCKRPCKY